MHERRFAHLPDLVGWVEGEARLLRRAEELAGLLVAQRVARRRLQRLLEQSFPFWIRRDRAQRRRLVEDVREVEAGGFPLLLIHRESAAEKRVDGDVTAHLLAVLFDDLFVVLQSSEQLAFEGGRHARRAHHVCHRPPPLLHADREREHRLRAREQRAARGERLHCRREEVEEEGRPTRRVLPPTAAAAAAALAAVEARDGAECADAERAPLRLSLQRIGRRERVKHRGQQLRCCHVACAREEGMSGGGGGSAAAAAAAVPRLS